MTQTTSSWSPRSFQVRENMGLRGDAAGAVGTVYCMYWMHCVWPISTYQQSG